jgi:hypothetical protein
MDNDMDMDDQVAPPAGHLPYGFMEREIAFKLLASHAMVDEEFFYALRDDPVGAAAQLHIALTDKDVDYLKRIVEWDTIETHANTHRKALHLDMVTNSW